MKKKNRTRTIAIVLVATMAIAVFVPVISAIRNRENNDSTTAAARPTAERVVETEQDKLIRDAKASCMKKNLKIHFSDDLAVWSFQEIDAADHAYFASTMVTVDDYDSEFELCCIFSGSGEEVLNHYIYVGGKVFVNDQKYNEELSAERLPVK